MERFCHEIGDVLDGGIIYAERRGVELDEPLELVLLVGTPVVGGPGMPNREEVETQPGQANDEIRFITNVNGAYYTRNLSPVSRSLVQCDISWNT